MALDFSHYQVVVQAKMDAVSAASTLDDLVTLAITTSKIKDAIAVSDVQAAAAAGVTSITGAATGALQDITTARTSATGAIGTARGGALTDIEAARTKAIQDVQQAGGGANAAGGISFAPTGQIAATNVQAALAEVDSEKTAKASNLSDLADPKAARANLGLEKFTARGDAAYTILAGDRTVALTAALTGPRVFTLPAASALNPGATLRIMDQAGGISAANTLTIQAAGTDKLNGAAAAVFAAPYTDFLLTTDGVSAWTYDVQSLARGGTGATTAAGARANLGLGSAAQLTAGVAGGAATLDGSTGKLLAAQIPDALLGTVRYQGGWDAAANSPTLAAPSAANKGAYYIVLTAGTTALAGPKGSITDWQVGDWAVSDGTYWEKVDSSDQVISVVGLQGAITGPALKAALAVAIGDVAGLQAALDAKAAASYATTADIWAGTDTGKIVTAKALRDAQVPQTLAASAAPAWNAALGFNARITLTTNTTFQTPTNLVEGLTYVLRAKQDATGGRTGSYTSAFNFGADGPPTLSTAANAEDALTFLCVDAATPRLSFVGIKKGV